MIASCREKPTVFAFAMLCAETSSPRCWARMPESAVCRPKKVEMLMRGR